MDNFYDILKVKQDASSETIRQSYKKLVLEHHPDKGGDIKTFQEIQGAYECLSDDISRARYNYKLDHEIKTNFINADDFNNQPENNFNNIFGAFMNSELFMNGFFTNGNSPSNNFSEKLNIHLSLNITLMDIYNEPKKTIQYTRRVIVNKNGNIAENLKEGICWKVCSSCKGIGNKYLQISPMCVQSINCKICNSRGFILINGSKMADIECSAEFIIAYGTQDGHTNMSAGYGHVIYNKQKKKFQVGDVVITFVYDINETNKILKKNYNFSNISINNVHLDTVEYKYEANIFEFITGTEFNLPLPNGKYISISVKNLYELKQIKGKGLPQYYGDSDDKENIMCGDITIYFEHKQIKENIYIPEFEKINLRRIMRNYYPKLTNEFINVIKL